MKLDPPLSERDELGIKQKAKVDSYYMKCFGLLRDINALLEQF